MITIHRATLASAIALFVGFSGGARADVLTENFEGAFPAWESGWFGTQSNARNVYCGTLGCSDRGNNPDGLWIANADIAFDAAFGATLTSFSLGVAGFSETSLQAFDSANQLIFNQDVTLTRGAFTDPGVYANFTITSTTGISHLLFTGGGVVGNTSIDNLSAVTATAAIPEPQTYALMLAGLGVLGFVARRRRAAR